MKQKQQPQQPVYKATTIGGVRRHEFQQDDKSNINETAQVTAALLNANKVQVSWPAIEFQRSYCPYICKHHYEDQSPCEADRVSTEFNIAAAGDERIYVSIN
jgi:hypothetical protein